MTTKFTDDDWARLTIARDEALRIGLNTEPVDRQRAETNFKKLYKMLLDFDLQKIIWIDGPNEIVNVDEAAGENPHAWWGWDYNWANYLAFLDSIPSVDINKELFEKLLVYRDLQHAHIWWSFDTCVVACEHPVELHVDDRYRLHNPYGMALRYKNGYGMYSLEGVTVTEKFIKDPGGFTLQQVKDERNAERRRLMIQYCYGLRRFLADTKAKLLDSNGNKEKLFEGEDGAKFLICTDGSTNRTYELTVPRNCATVAQAQAALSGLPVNNLLERS